MNCQMTKAILGKKLGMTSIFQNGKMIPVTVIQAGPCYVTQIKSKENDGYQGVQVGFLPRKKHRTNKPLMGHFAKAGIDGPLKILKEIPVIVQEGQELAMGMEIKADIFEKGDIIDVTGTSKGKGFAGSIKRHGFSRGPMGHGSHFHRANGSNGSIDGSHVFKGKKMPGRMGGNQVTVQNLEIADVIADKNIILVKGAIPGAKKSIVTVKSAIKKQGR